jgi:tetratricopeptide (TPR) repeat protein
MLCLRLLLLADSFEGAYSEGLIALNANNLATAEARLESASKLQPQDARVWLALAQTYWRLRKSQAAAFAAKRAESFARDPAILHALAFYHFEAANYTKAAELETRYAESAPEAFSSAIELYLQAGKPKSAIEVAGRALKSDDRAEFHSLLGKAYDADNEPDKAIAEFKAAIIHSPYDEWFYSYLAQLQLKQQSFAAALETLDAGRKYFDKSAQLELEAGVAYYGLRRFPEAIDAFLRTIKLDPAMEQPYVFLGRMLDQAEDRMPGILEVFSAFAIGRPQNYLSSFLYGKALAHENPQEAATNLRKSIARNGAFWESHFELGILLQRDGRLAEAASEFRRSIELNPKDPTAHYRLAQTYDRLGKADEARVERELHAKLSAAGSSEK